MPVVPGNVDYEREVYRSFPVPPPELLDLLKAQGLTMGFDPRIGGWTLVPIPLIRTPGNVDPAESDEDAGDPALWGPEVVVYGDPDDEPEGESDDPDGDPDTGTGSTRSSSSPSTQSSASHRPDPESGDMSPTVDPIEIMIAAAMGLGARIYSNT